MNIQLSHECFSGLGFWKNARAYALQVQSELYNQRMVCYSQRYRAGVRQRPDRPVPLVMSYTFTAG